MKKTTYSFLWAIVVFFGIALITFSCNDDTPTIADEDKDGIADTVDNCPSFANPSQADADGDGIGDACEADTDEDGIIDDIDNCINTPNPDQLDADGDGIGDVCEPDTDEDGIIDDIDNCINTPNPDQVDLDEDGVGDICETDTDEDGVVDDVDNCINTPNPDQLDADGDGIGDACEADTDEDGIPDDTDNCVDTPNPDQLDADGDGIGDACEADTDEDGIPDDTDNCIDTPNPDQLDADGDGIGDACEADTDEDGIPDDTDNCINTPNAEQLDADGDGIGDACDNCPNTSNYDQEDLDADGIGDACDEVIEIPEARCIDGMAGIYACKDYDLIRRVNLTALGGANEGNDCWGWTDSASGREFALVGTNTNTSFVEITNPYSPVVIGYLPTATVNSSWRDVKVYQNHAFIVSEASNHGMQVFDLNRLLNASDMPVTFEEDAWYQGFGNAHNIVINEESGYAYAVGTRTYGGGPHIVDISNPKSPVAAGGFSQGGYSHDAQVVTYNGPDTDYTGREILIGSNANKIVIADVTDKNNIVEISSTSYSNIGYTHQGWFSEDMHYFFLGDETDELNFGFNTRTLAFDFSDLDNPSLAATYSASTKAIDHNMYVKGDLLYQANYTAGIRVIDISDVSNMNEVAYFDTYPANDNASFNGAWNIYPYFPSGLIIVSDINRGLFIIRKQE